MGQSCHSPEVPRWGELGCSARGEDAQVGCHPQLKIQLRVGQKGGEALEGEAQGCCGTPVLGETQPVSAQGLVCPGLVGHEPRLEKESGQEIPASVTAANDCGLCWKPGGKAWELWEGKDVVSGPDSCCCSSLDPALWWSPILN